MKFQKAIGNWTDLRTLGNMLEVDFHYGQYKGYAVVDRPERLPFAETMDRVYNEAFGALQRAQAQGKEYVMFRHGHSTSGPGRRSSRSVVRALMRSKAATPYIVRAKCVEHYSVFVAAIRPVPGPERPS